MPKDLTIRQVEALTKPGLHRVAHGLYLCIAQPPATGRSWMFRIIIKNKPQKRGLGSCSGLNLAQAKIAAAKMRIDIFEGKYEEAGAARASAKGPAPTFGELAEPYIAEHEPAWARGRGNNWRFSLKVHAAGIYNLPVDEITPPLVADAIRAVWYGNPDTGKKLRGRVEAVLEYARANEHRSGPNPASWKGGLSILLRKLDFSKGRGRLPALPYAQIPELAAQLIGLNSPSAKMLLFTLLCGNRSGGAYNALWKDIDLPNKVWTIPQNRTKTKRGDFRIPLTDMALAIIKSMPVYGDYVFSRKDGKPFSDAAMLMCIKGLYPNVTVHGTVRQGLKSWSLDNRWPDHLSEEPWIIRWATILASPIPPPICLRSAASC